jgi:hypothetical protein
MRKNLGCARGVLLLSLLAAAAAFGAEQQGPGASLLRLIKHPPLSWPISLVDIMRASVEIPAEGIWAAEGNQNMTDEDWALADEDAVNLIVASAVIAHPGTGKNDAVWTKAKDWQGWATDLGKSAAAIREAVRQRDPQAMAISGDRLGQVCEACHTKYRPQTPSDGFERYPFYPKRDLVR